VKVPPVSIAMRMQAGSVLVALMAGIERYRVGFIEQ